MCLDRQGEEAKVGDLVRTGANMTPVYRVVALDGDKAWLRDEQTGADFIVPACRCAPLSKASA